MEVFQPALAARLGLLVAFVNHLIGELPWNCDHADIVLLLDLVRHFAQLFAAHVHAAEAQQPFAVVQHRLNHLKAMARLRLRDPNQTPAPAVDGGHVGFHLRLYAENRRRSFLALGLLLRRGDAFL